MPPTDIAIPLTLRIGITGHRSLSPDQTTELCERVRAVLSTISVATTKLTQDPTSGYAPTPPLLRIISPIAEGADRIVAQEGLAAGHQLQCPLPFPRELYANDFKSDDSKQTFTDLLSKASAIFELDGQRSDPAHPAPEGTPSSDSLAYQTVGRVMLAQSDLILAIWDGKPANGVGGTAQMVAEAASQEIPIIWLEPGAPGVVRLRLCVGNAKDCVIEHESWESKLSDVLARLLRLPPEHDGGHDTTGTCISHDVFSECLSHPRPKHPRLGRLWSTFIRVMSYPPPRKPRKANSPPQSNEMPDPFDAEYHKANSPAKYFASLYRGSFLANYLLGTLAVLLALLVVVAPGWQPVWAWMELATIVTIVLLIRAANKRRWHQKSIDCRYYAEQLRQMRFLWPLARVTPSSRPPAHHAFGDPRATCMNWRFRAVLRNIGMPSARVTPEYRAACLDHICNQWIDGPNGQISYHHSTAVRLSRVDHRLHLTARVLFVLTAASCIGHLLIHDEHVAVWLTLLTGVLPAAAAAAHAISSQGEFRRLAERSKSMAADLVHVERSLRTLAKSDHSFTAADLYRVVSPAAAAMMDEVTDWRILYNKVPLEPA